MPGSCMSGMSQPDSLRRTAGNAAPLLGTRTAEGLIPFCLFLGPLYVILCQQLP